MRTLIVTAAVLLTATSTALAGGWATVELSSTPDQAAAGPWQVDLTVMQHGVTPLEDIKPVVTINDGTGVRKFPAVATGRSGVYRANVVFPHEGRWRYAIWDGFSQRHTYPPVDIGEAAATASAPRPAPGDDGLPWTALLVAIAAGLLAAGLTVLVQRRRTPGLTS